MSVPTKYSDLMVRVPEDLGTTRKRNSPLPTGVIGISWSCEFVTVPLSSTVILNAKVRALSETNAPCGETAVMEHVIRLPATTVEAMDVHDNLD